MDSESLIKIQYKTDTLLVIHPKNWLFIPKFTLKVKIIV